MGRAARLASLIRTETARLPGSMVAASPSARELLVILAPISGSLALTGKRRTRSAATLRSRRAVLGMSFSGMRTSFKSDLLRRVPAGMSRVAATHATVFSLLGLTAVHHRSQVSRAAETQARTKIRSAFLRSIGFQ